MQMTIGTASGLGTKHQCAASCRHLTYVEIVDCICYIYPAAHNFQTFHHCFPSRPFNASGWVGKFVSFSPNGVSEDDIRFQDIWLRTFQETDVDGKFRLKMIRKADQAAKSWPRSGDSL